MGIYMFNLRKIATLLLSLMAMSTAQAITFTNKISQPVTLYNFTFISGIEIYKFPVTLQPNEIFVEDDIASFSVRISDTITDSFTKLNDSTKFFFTFDDAPWSRTYIVSISHLFVENQNLKELRYYQENMPVKKLQYYSWEKMEPGYYYICNKID